MLRTFEKLPMPIVTLLVFRGTAASALSTVFLSGWSGGSGAMTTTVVIPAFRVRDQILDVIDSIQIQTLTMVVTQTILST
jgi:hypothetical protein